MPVIHKSGSAISGDNKLFPDLARKFAPGNVRFIRKGISEYKIWYIMENGMEIGRVDNTTGVIRMFTIDVPKWIVDLATAIEKARGITINIYL